MNAWLALILAGLFEMSAVLMINEMYKRKSWMAGVGMISLFSASFLLLGVAMRELPMGTAYAVWTGIGAAGGALFGMLLYGESKDWRRVVCIVLIISATIGLKYL